MNKYEQKPDYIVDLHGYTTEEARVLLIDIFAEKKYKRVRIITGKGDLRNGPVLRSFVEGFLKNRTIPYRTAKVSDGGEGALEATLST